jgi:hypothetical protein
MEGGVGMEYELHIELSDSYEAAITDLEIYEFEEDLYEDTGED